VTFVTLVWSEETGRAGRGWVYAYETNLTEFFSSELTPPSLPPVDQATAPEAPVVLPENTSSAAPERSSPPEDGQKINDRPPKKMPRVLAVFLVLFAFGLLLGITASGYVFYVNPYSKKSVPVTAQARPFAGDGAVVLKVSDMGTLRSLAFGLEPAVPSLIPGNVSESPAGENILSSVRPSMGSLKELFEAMDEISLLVVPSDDPAVYASFVEQDGALDIFMSRLGTPFTVSAWDSNPGGKMTGWKISLPLLENPVLYVLKRPYGKRNIVYAASTEEGVGEMLSTSRDPDRRFVTERATSGKDFLQIKFPGGFTSGAAKRALAPLGRTPEAQTERAGNVLWTTGEISWTKEGNVLEHETYSDFMTKNPELAANMPKITQDTKFFGDGELTCFVAFDAGFLMKCAFPDSPNPVGEALGIFGEKQIALAAAEGGLKTILKNARLSAACTEKAGRAQTAYLLLETDADETLDKLWRMYSPFTAMLGGEPLKLDGWNSAISAYIPFYGGSGANIVLAHKRGALLIGMGEAANFSKKVPIKNEYKDYVSPENVANVIVSPKFCDLLLGLMDNYYAGYAKSGDAYKDARNGLTAFRNSFQLFCGNVKPSGHANGKLVLTEGGNPTVAALKLLSQIALAMPRRL
ncbi:MAG: hypothetical protein LBL05_07790, partial [Synergistaceae bacterium]|nr:hypothetical protein [Synergistaceae bacterium]